MPTWLGEEGQWLSAAGASAEIHDRSAATGGGDDLPAAARLVDAALSAAGGLPVQPDRLRHRAAWHWYRHGSGGSPGLGSLTGCATTAYSERKPERHRRRREQAAAAHDVAMVDCRGPGPLGGRWRGGRGWR